MKIGILTHHYINNFGAFLQAYSLQEALKELFPNDEVYMINCINLKHFIINVGGWFRFYKSKENIVDWFEKIHLPLTFSKARKKYFNLTKTCYTAQDIESLGLDYIIVGSDEVWNYREIKGNAKVKFGLGLDKESLIAYAPSVGQTDGLEIPNYVENGIKKFKAVSARDISTENLARQIRHEKIQRVVDPTFLINIPDEAVPGVKQPYILFYYCDGFSEIEKKKILEYAHQNSLAVYGGGECDKAYTSTTVNLTPFQWVWMFRHAQYIVTGTFHGVVFSMLNHRQFACYLTNPSRIKKVSSLLEEFGLADRRCEAKASQIIEKLKDKIDYAEIEKIFNQHRAESKGFLKEAISR